jgi:lipoprotein NlpI
MKTNYNKIMTDSFINKGERYAIAASKLYDKSSQVWELLGLCDLYRKNNQLALEKFKRCYAVDTTYLSGINYLGFTYWNLGNIDSAYYYFNFVINKEPYFNYSANNMINMLIKNNRRQEADSLLNVWKTRFPNDVKLQNKIQEVNASQLYYNN